MPPQHAFRSDLLVLYARSSLTPATGRRNGDRGGVVARGQRGVNGRSEATEPGTTSDLVFGPEIFLLGPGQPRNQRRSSWSERSDVTRNKERPLGNRIGPEGAALEDEGRWPRPWAAPQGIFLQLYILLYNVIDEYSLSHRT